MKKNIQDRGNKMEKDMRSHGDGQYLNVAKISDPGKKGGVADVVGKDRLGPGQRKLCIIC